LAPPRRHLPIQVTYSLRVPVARKHMSRDLLTVAPDVPLQKVAERMVSRDVGAALVMDGGRLVGIVTERDVLRAVARGIQEGTRVDDCMTSDPETMEPDESTQHAAVLMLHGGFRHLPITEGDEVIGILSIRDLMRVVIEDSAPRGA
jgi:CBS domain-containing protein